MPGAAAGSCGCGQDGSLRGPCLAPVPLAAPHLLAMGTLGCDPDPRLATAPQGWRAAECPILDVGLRKSCGTATTENGTLPLWRRAAVAGGAGPALFSPAPLWFPGFLGAQLEVGGSGKFLPFPKPVSLLVGRV